jgi:hypothetical protein
VIALEALLAGADSDKTELSRWVAKRAAILNDGVRRPLDDFAEATA